MLNIVKVLTSDHPFLVMIITCSSIWIIPNPFRAVWLRKDAQRYPEIWGSGAQDITYRWASTVNIALVVESPFWRASVHFLRHTSQGGAKAFSAGHSVITWTFNLNCVWRKVLDISSTFLIAARQKVRAKNPVNLHNSISSTEAAPAGSIP